MKVKTVQMQVSFIVQDRQTRLKMVHMFHIILVVRIRTLRTGKKHKHSNDIRDVGILQPPSAPAHIIPHRIHGTGIFTYTWHSWCLWTFKINVGKYTSNMDLLGNWEGGRTQLGFACLMLRKSLWGIRNNSDDSLRKIHKRNHQLNKSKSYGVKKHMETHLRPFIEATTIPLNWNKDRRYETTLNPKSWNLDPWHGYIYVHWVISFIVNSKVHYTIRTGKGTTHTFSPPSFLWTLALHIRKETTLATKEKSRDFWPRKYNN